MTVYGSELSLTQTWGENNSYLYIKGCLDFGHNKYYKNVNALAGLFFRDYCSFEELHKAPVTVVSSYTKKFLAVLVSDRTLRSVLDLSRQGLWFTREFEWLCKKLPGSRKIWLKDHHDCELMSKCFSSKQTVPPLKSFERNLCPRWLPCWARAQTKNVRCAWIPCALQSLHTVRMCSVGDVLRT